MVKRNERHQLLSCHSFQLDGGEVVLGTPCDLFHLRGYRTSEATANTSNAVFIGFVRGVRGIRGVRGFKVVKF